MTHAPELVRALSQTLLQNCHQGPPRLSPSSDPDPVHDEVATVGVVGEEGEVVTGEESDDVRRAWALLAVARAVDAGYVLAEDVIEVVGLERACRELPSATWARVLRACLGADQITHELIVREVGSQDLVRLLDAADAWALLSAAIERDQSEDAPEWLRGSLDEAIALGLVAREDVERRVPVAEALDLDFGDTPKARADYAAILWVGLTQPTFTIEDVEAVRGRAEHAWPGWLVREAMLEAGEIAIGRWSFERHVVAIRHELLHYAAKLAGGNRALAEDVVQDALALALRAWPRWRPSTGHPAKDARSWMYRIICNTYMKDYRAATTRRKYVARTDYVRGAHDGELVEVQLPGRERAVLHGHQAPTEVDSPFGDEVEAAIAALPLEQQQVVREYFAAGGSSGEVGLRLGVPKNTVHTRRARALAAMREALRDYAQREYGIGMGDAECDEEAEAGDDVSEFAVA